MTEILQDMELTHRGLNYQKTITDRTVSAVAGALYDIDAMRASVNHLEDVRERFLNEPIPPNIGHRTLQPDDFGPFEVYYKTLARIGRKPFRDKIEKYDTTNKVAAIIAELHEQQPIYTKTKSRGNIPGSLEYTLGMITGTTAEIVPDGPRALAQNKLVLWVRTLVKEVTEIDIDDIAAGLEERTNTGPDTPLIVVGRKAVKSYVERAYAEPRAERKACGNDSGDIFEALCKSGMPLYELGFTKEEIEEQKKQVIASLGRVCRNRATYQRQVVALVPMCDSPEEALRIINNARDGKPTTEIHPQFHTEYQNLMTA